MTRAPDIECLAKAGVEAAGLDRIDPVAESVSRVAASRIAAATEVGGRDREERLPLASEGGMNWKPSEFLIAVPGCTSSVAGYEYRGLGLHQVRKPSPKGRRPPEWALAHLGSGHRVCLILGKVSDAFPVASEIAECGDWTFDGLRGWQNSDPQLLEKFRAVFGRHPKHLSYEGGAANEETARQIAQARAA